MILKNSSLPGLVLATMLPLCASTAVLAVGGETKKTDAPVSTLELAYNLYAGGLPLGKVALSARLQGADYKANSSLETSGIVNRFWHSKIDTAAVGQIGDNTVSPTTYDSFAIYQNVRRQQVVLSYDQNGPASLFADPPYEENRFPVSDTQKRKTLDPLSAAVFLTAAFTPEADKPCGATAPIFDGRRRYDVALSFVKNANVKLDNGLYEGPAVVCKIAYNQIAGYRQTLIEQGKKIPEIYAWVARFTSKADPNRVYLLPLRIWAETEYGMMVVVADRVNLDGAPLGQARNPSTPEADGRRG